MVDGDRHDCALAAMILARAMPDARVEEAATASRFTQALARGRFDVIVAERELPWAAGADVLETLRVCQPDAAVVILARAVGPAAVVQALRSGAADVLVKGSEGYLQLPMSVQSARDSIGATGGEIETLRARVTELEASNQGLAEFPFTAAHELDAPLRLVDRQLQQLQRVRDALDAEGLQALDTAAAGIRRMQGLIDDLLTYARLGTERPAMTACDSSALVDQAIAHVLADGEDVDAAITHGHLPVIQGDPARLLMLFRNLLANAVKFRADKRPQVVVSARADAGHVIFAVRDNGIGIDPRSAGRLFGMFQRLHPGYPGTGLGLVICRRIVEQHGGRIWIESEAGAGATFFFTIPDTPGRMEGPRA